MNPRARRLRRQRRKDRLLAHASDVGLKHQNAHLEARLAAQHVRKHRKPLLSEQVTKESPPEPLGGGALLTAMLSGKAIP